MTSSVAESFQNSQTMTVGLTGTIVLSSSTDLLFIDRKALTLLGLFESDSLVQENTKVLPACLMALVQEIAAAGPSIRTNPFAMGARVRRVFGLPEQPVRVQGFSILNPVQQDMRIVLVLSQWNSVVDQEA